MSGPKHLWSGDWERESAEAAARRHAGGPVPAAAPASPEPAPSAVSPGGGAPPRPAAASRPRTPASAQRRRQGDRRPAVAAGVAVLIVAAVTVAIVLATAGSPSPGTGNAAAVRLSGRPLQWLGMQIAPTGSGGAVIQTVQLGSPGDAAGFEPGDVIVSVDNQLVTSTAQVRSLVSRMHLGEQITVTVERGSSVFSTSFPMTERPAGP